MRRWRLKMRNDERRIHRHPNRKSELSHGRSRPNSNPTIVGFLCNWCCYGGADLAGVSRFQYPPHLRVIRLMCSGRVDLEFIFRAFAKRPTPCSSAAAT